MMSSTDRVGIGLARRDPIQQRLRTPPRPARGRATCWTKRWASSSLHAELGAGAAPLAERRGGVRAEPLDLRHQLRQPLPGRRFGLHDRRPPAPAGVGVEREQRLDRRHRAIRPLAIRLVDHEDVGDLHDPGLERLHLVARAGHERHDRDVGGADDVDFVLADADGLDEDDVLAGGVEDERGVGGRARQAAEVAARRHAADEDAGVGRRAPACARDRRESRRR